MGLDKTKVVLSQCEITCVEDACHAGMTTLLTPQYSIAALLAGMLRVRCQMTFCKQRNRGGVTQPVAAVQAMTMLDFAKENHAVPEVIRPLKRFALKWHMAVAAGLALGFAVGRAPASVIPRLLQG